MVNTLYETPGAPVATYPRYFSQFYRNDAAVEFWAKTPADYVHILVVLSLYIDSNRMFQTSYTKLAALFGVHRTTISRVIQALANWHGPDNMAASPALAVQKISRQTRFGHRWAGVTITLADWLPVGFGHRAPVCAQDTTLASVQTECTTKDLRDPGKEKENIDPPSLPPSEPACPTPPLEEDPIIEVHEPKAGIDDLQQANDDQSPKTSDQGNNASAVLSLDQIRDAGFRLLKDIGVSDASATRLAALRSPKVIQSVIESQRKRSGIRDLARWVVVCLNNYVAPPTNTGKPKIQWTVTPAPNINTPDETMQARAVFKTWWDKLMPEIQQSYAAAAEALYITGPDLLKEARRNSRVHERALWWDFLRKWCIDAGYYRPFC